MRTLCSWIASLILGAAMFGDPVHAQSPFVSVFLLQQHFAYFDGTGVLWDSWYDGPSNSWNLHQINCGKNSTCSSKSPNARTDGPAASSLFVSVFLQQQHFAYKVWGGVLWDSWYDGPSNSWNLQQIDCGDPATAPPHPV